MTKKNGFFVNPVYPLLLLTVVFLVSFLRFLPWPNSVWQKTFSIFIFSVSSGVILQSGLFLYALIYAWIEPDRVKKNASPEVYHPPRHSFTALLPARHEEQVIGDTIRALARINYPEDKKEVLVICRSDDPGTIAQARKTIAEIGKTNIRLVIFDDLPINKPHGLNVALGEITKDIVVIFDAEDEPHPDLYHIVNTVIQRDKADVVQAGVQLINYRTTWFSTLNVLEYYFWFKSALHLFNRLGVTPLGGNTVFFKKELLDKIGGWDENALTEDAEIGLKLSLNKARIRLVYDSRHATREETPHSTASFLKQRTRWHQGFLQVFLKGQWRKMPGQTKKILSAYLLAWPEIQALYFLYIPFSVLTILFLKLPVWLAMYSTLPFFLLILMFVVLNVGLYEFTREYRLRYFWWLPVKMLVTFFPYQLLLGASAVRGVWRLLQGNLKWEKTTHLNTHRQGQLARAESEITG